MIKVECDGCKAPYQIDEKRIPPTGLKMRCPKCGTNLLVMKPGAAPPAEPADLPAPLPSAQRRTAPQGVPRPPGRPAPAPPLPPTPFPALGAEEDLLDLPSAAPPSAGRPAFGELDFGEPDFGEPALPAVSRSPRATKLGQGSSPRSTTTSPLGKPGGPPPAPEPMRGGGGGFGEIDLLVDLPAMPGAAEQPMAELDFEASDLPAIRGAEPAPISAGFELSTEFGDVDLPAIDEQDPDLPSVPRAGADLPSVRSGRDAKKPRNRTVRFGDLDPEDRPELPVAGRSPGRSPAFGHIDLPSMSEKPALPVNRGSATPREAPRGFGEIDLPLISGAEDLPAHTSGGALPVTAKTSGLPARAAGGAPPMSAPAGVPSSARRPQRSSPDNVGEELSLGPSSAPTSSARGAFDDSDRAVPGKAVAAAAPDMRGAIALEGRAERSSVGDEVELSAEAGAIGDAAFPPRVERPRADASEAPSPKRSKARRLALVTVVLLAVGGGSLALEPSIGPFGVNFISDRVNAKKHAETLGELRAAVQSDLDEDTGAAAGRALAKAQQAQAATPRYQPLAAYCAYVALARSLRFGHRGEDEALAKQLLAGPAREPSDALALARTAGDAESGQLDRARQTVSALLQTAPTDVDAAVLAGEIELAAKVPDKALAAWKQAVVGRGEKKSARALFGLARAQVLAGDAAGATTSARAVLDASPSHVGARILLASQLWQLPDHEVEAIGELKKVTEDQAIRGAASDAELVAAFTLLGRIHLSRSRISAAEQAFAAALKLDPQAVQALVGNGELFYRSGRYTEAGARFEAAIRADDSNVPAKIGAAKTWLSQERMKEAKDLLKKVRESHMKDPSVAFWLGRVEEALGNKKEAEALYNEAIKAGEGGPEVVDAYVALARLLSGVGRTDEANQKLLDATKRFPDLAALHRAKGELLLQTGRYDDAKEELTVALAKDDDLGTRFKLGVAYRRLRMFDDASMTFDKVSGIDKDYPGLALERGLLFEETGQSDKALEMYSDALRKAPKDIDLKLRVGSTQVMAGHAAQAEATLREVVKDRPTSAEANHFLGRALLVKGTNMAEAMRFLDAAVNIDGNRAEYLLYVGWAANDTGQAARAEAALKRALELDHELGDAYWQLGVWYQKQRATEDALKNLQTAIEKRPSRFEAYATMALCYQDQQRWPEAEAAFRKAIAGNGAVAEWHYRLGKQYASHGNQAGAGPELELAVKFGDVADHTPPGWLFDAHLLLAEALRGRDRDQAILHYRRFLKLAPSGNAYIDEAQKALLALHADPTP